ncbi:hypothetical protein [Streptomyces tropicalis]|uniref:Serine protease n=1 Tax=Streptomyces tropicalis TaxID=3034234 RepID=A0ABT6A1S1_9ACTN|nr:hypothetical protein [Streptomyces tropicalis]MDF3298402.1 hypothetical protein [Streptomyces tropicalis]
MGIPHQAGGRRFLHRAAVLLTTAATAMLGATISSSASAAPTGSPTPAAAASTGGQVQYVHTHGETVRVVTHGRHGVVPQKDSAAAHGARKAAAGGPLYYNNGPVEHALKVYLVFWGSQWNSDSNGVANYEKNLFQGLGTSQDSWSTVNSQYTDNSGGRPSFGGAVLAGSWTDSASAAPASSSQAQIAAEANVGAQHFGVSGTDVQIVVLSPSGTSPDGFPNSGFCAWHDWNGNVTYTNMPYVLDAGASCGANSVQNRLDGFSIVGGHEYAETATDPQPASGWVASDGEENGDLCAWQNLGTISLPTGTFAMQPTWSNDAGGCAMSG